MTRELNDLYELETGRAQYNLSRSIYRDPFVQWVADLARREVEWLRRHQQ